MPLPFSSISLSYDLTVPFKDAKHGMLDGFERAYIVTLLERHGGNLSAASRESGLSRRHLRDLARRFGVYRLPTERELAA
jgi:DNA-binding NtrC family response regulator